MPEGVSLIQNFRSQVQEIVTQKGVGQLIQTLRDKNATRQKQEQQQAGANAKLVAAASPRRGRSRVLAQRRARPLQGRAA